MSAVTEMAPRVLVVEDDAAIAELVRYNLEAEGLQSTVAATGEEAELQVARTTSISSCWTGCCRASPASSCAGVFGAAMLCAVCRS